MENEVRKQLADSIESFKLPQFNEIPDIGLFLEQTTKFVEEYLKPLENITITSSMISNYVKKGIISNPIKKQYNREQITHIFFVAIAKSVLSLEDIQMMLSMLKQNYDCQLSYEYFCTELTNVLHETFGIKEAKKQPDKNYSDDKILLRNIIITVAHKIYLDKTFRIMQQQNAERDTSHEQKK